MKVDVFDRNGELLYTYDINLQGTNLTPSEDEYIDETKKCIVDDELADDEEITNYEFRIRK